MIGFEGRKPCVVTAAWIIFSSLAAAPFLSAAQSKSDHFSVSNSSELLKIPPSETEAMVSVEVKIEEILPGAFGKSYLRAIFADGKGPLWIAPVAGINNEIIKGDVIRVLGYWAMIQGDMPALITERNSSGKHLLAVCYYNFRTKRGIFYPFKIEPNDCSKWMDAP